VLHLPSKKISGFALIGYPGNELNTPSGGIYRNGIPFLRGDKLPEDSA
jgi:hypothetical protein